MTDHAGTLFAWARSLEPTESEVAAVLERLAQGRRALRSQLVVVFAAVVVALGGLLAVPASRAALGGALSALDSFFGGGSPPGQPVGAAAVPWLDDVAQGQVSVLARSGGERLYAYRSASGAVCLAFGHHAAECDGDASWWRSLLERHAAALFGPVPGEAAGTAVAWGVARENVSRVELRYDQGGSTSAVVSNGGFVLIAESVRTPSELASIDRQGRTIEVLNVRDRQWSFCTTESGC
jgi:hypothetical protein